MHQFSVCFIVPYTNQRHCKERLKMLHIPTDVSLGCILTAQACDYLSHVRSPSNCIISGSEIPF